RSLLQISRPLALHRVEKLPGFALCEYRLQGRQLLFYPLRERRGLAGLCGTEHDAPDTQMVLINAAMNVLDQAGRRHQMTTEEIRLLPHYMHREQRGRRGDQE